MNKYYVLITIKNLDKDIECEWKSGFENYDEAVEKADYLCKNLIGIFSVSVYHFDHNFGCSVVDYVKEK